MRCFVCSRNAICWNINHSPLSWACLSHHAETISESKLCEVPQPMSRGISTRMIEGLPPSHESVSKFVDKIGDPKSDETDQSNEERHKFWLIRSACVASRCRSRGRKWLCHYAFLIASLLG